MKKILLPVFLLSLLFFSCKKDSQHPPVNTGSKKYAVQFNVGGFQQMIIAAAAKHQSMAIKSGSSRASASDALTLHYLVFDASGKFVHTIVQPADSGKTTYVTDSLSAGTYTFDFAIGGADMEVSTNYAELTYPYAGAGGDVGPVWEDTFTKQVKLTVGGGNVSQNVTLQRLVAQLEVGLTGTIPSDAATFEIKVDEEYVYGKMAGGPDQTLGNQGVSYRYEVYSMTPATTKFDLLLLNTVTPFNVDLTAYDSSGALLTEAHVNNVKCAADTRTLLTGALFGSSSNNVSISLNTPWDPNPYTTINF